MWWTLWKRQRKGPSLATGWYHPLMVRKLLPAFVLGLAFLPTACAPAPGLGSQPEVAPAAAHSGFPAPSAAPRVDFQTRIRPILETRCRPCHFEGGTMYEQLPFDRPDTIHELGDKMFTRIKDPQEQEVLRAFLAGRHTKS